MPTTILWSGREYYSLENCLVHTGDHGAEVSSTIVGYYEGTIYQVDYRLRTNRDWHTMRFEINCRQNDLLQAFLLESDGNGNWTQNGEPAALFDGCLDVDLPLTPFTNTLPIRRLGLSAGQEQYIRVIYCDLLAQELKPVRQKYSCLSPTEYHYENVPNDFEATITVDEEGLVIDYPQLFVRKAARNAGDTTTY